MPETLIEIGVPPLRPGSTTMLPLNVSAASGLNTTWKDVLLRGLKKMGIVLALTTNSGRLLVTCWIVVD